MIFRQKCLSLQSVGQKNRTMKQDTHIPMSHGRYAAPQAELLEFYSLYGILADSELESYVDDGPDIEW